MESRKAPGAEAGILKRTLLALSLCAAITGCGPTDPEAEISWSSIRHATAVPSIRITRVAGPATATPNKLVPGLYRIEGIATFPETEDPASQIGPAVIEINTHGFRTEPGTATIEPSGSTWPETAFSIDLTVGEPISEDDCYWPFGTRTFTGRRSRQEVPCGEPGLFVHSYAGAMRNRYEFDEVMFFDADDHSAESMTNYFRRSADAHPAPRAAPLEGASTPKVFVVPTRHWPFATHFIPVLEDHIEVIPEANRAQTIDEVNIVVVVGRGRTGTTGKACAYTGGVSAVPKTLVRTIQVVAANRGTLLAEQDLEGSMPWCPGSVTTRNRTIINRNFTGDVEPKAIMNWAMAQSFAAVQGAAKDPSTTTGS